MPLKHDDVADGRDFEALHCFSRGEGVVSGSGARASTV